MGKEGLRREHRMCSLEIDMAPAAGAWHATVFVACQKEQRAVLLGYILLWFWGIFCCGMCVVAASLASNDNFNTNNAEASAANFSVF
jgi:hypothetical protein